MQTSRQQACQWLLSLLVVLWLAAAPTELQAADTAPTSTAVADPLAQVRVHMALETLQKPRATEVALADGIWHEP